MTADRRSVERPTTVVLSTDRFDAVVFDMDGVITDTAVVHRAAWKRMFDPFLEARGEPPFTEGDYARYVDGRPRQDGVRTFLAARGIHLPDGAPSDPPGDRSVWSLANRKNTDFERVLSEHGVRAFPGSVSLVESLQRNGIGTALISASRNCRSVLAAAGIASLFPVVIDGVVADSLALPGKPSPAVFLEAAKRLHAVPARAAIVEDGVAGIAAGRAGGFALVIGVDRRRQADALHAAGADVVVGDLADIAVQREAGRLWTR
jgi:alpha,alpha-trehalase